MQKKITIFAMHLDFGGIEKYISLLCKMFEKDYEIEIITTYKFREEPAFYFDPKIKIKYLVTDNLKDESLKKLIKQKKFIAVLKELNRRAKVKRQARKLNIAEIKSLKTDYVITTRTYHNHLINKYLKNSHVITIATEHNHHNNDQKYINDFISSVTNFNYVIHCTKELYDFYKDKIHGPKNILIENTIDIDNNKVAQLGNKKIISVGRISPEKGIFDLIDVMELIHEKDKKVTLTICGDGYQKEELENYIYSKKLNRVVKMTGFIGGDKLYREYLQASVYVMPSKSEAFGLVLLEAMHFGLPCISFSSASGARNLLDDGTGILIDRRNKEEMAENILKMLNDPKLQKKYQKKSLDKVKNYSLKNTYTKWKKEILH